jgi:hypothetical protein
LGFILSDIETDFRERAMNVHPDTLAEVRTLCPMKLFGLNNATYGQGDAVDNDALLTEALNHVPSAMKF